MKTNNRSDTGQEIIYVQTTSDVMFSHHHHNHHSYIIIIIITVQKKCHQLISVLQHDSFVGLCYMSSPYNAALLCSLHCKDTSSYFFD